MSKFFLYFFAEILIRYYPLCREQFVVISQKNHILAQKAAANGGVADMKDLNGEKLVMYVKNRFLRLTIDGFLEKHHIKPEESFSFDSTATCIQFVKNGFGCAIIPEMLSWEASADLSLFRLSPPIFWELGIIAGRQSSFSLEDSGFLDLLRATIKPFRP